MKNKKFIKWPLNLVLYRLIWAATLIFSMTIVPIALSSFISSIPVLIACAFSVDTIIFVLAVLIGYWTKILDSSTVIIMTPTQEQFAIANEQRKILEKEMERVRQDINRMMG